MQMRFGSMFVKLVCIAMMVVEQQLKMELEILERQQVEEEEGDLLIQFCNLNLSN
jgi:cell division protein FtsL